VAVNEEVADGDLLVATLGTERLPRRMLLEAGLRGEYPVALATNQVRDVFVILLHLFDHDVVQITLASPAPCAYFQVALAEFKVVLGVLLEQS
jgi:hypothetical protein